MDKKYQEGANLINKTELLEHATLSVLRHAKTENPMLKQLVNYAVNKRPLTIYDVNGKPLFYDFTIYYGNKSMGTIRTGASKILGSPVLAYELGNRTWLAELYKSKRTLLLKVRKKFPRHRILSPKLVCYSYPKLGLMFETIDSRKKRSKIIFDVADNSQVPMKESSSEFEGNSAWSFYDMINEKTRKEKLEKYNKANELRLKVSDSTRLTLTSTRKLSSLIAIKEINDIIALRTTKTRILQFCSHYNTWESRSHHCFVLHGQEVNDYCAVATCQMILCYYRYYYTQDDIAPGLNYTAGSGCPADQSGGYESLSNNHIEATFDTSATWNEAKNQIDALHPMKSGVPGHARACAGYSYDQWGFLGEIFNKKLYIYDPWPWNSDYKLAGSVYWEDWDSITHTNFIYTSLRYP